MKIVIRILIGLGCLIAALLITGLFTKKDYTVEREIVINKSKGEVFNYVKYLRNQDTYSKWAQMDPNAKSEWKGTDGTVGFTASWDSQNDEVGQGEQSISKIVEGERIDYDLRFIRPFEGEAKAYMTTESISGNQAKVKWGISSSMPYPMNLMLLFMNMEDMLANDLEVGLQNLKTLLEK
jgi:uncharacterized membrane protein